jgi:hypothetical protein
MFRRNVSPPFQDENNQGPRYTLAVASNCSTMLLRVRSLFSPRRWRRYVNPKRLFLQEPNGVTYQKMAFFTVTAVKPAKSYILLSHIPSVCSVVVCVTNNTTRVRIGYRIYSLWRFTAAHITITVNTIALVASWIPLTELHCPDVSLRGLSTSDSGD